MKSKKKEVALIIIFLIIQSIMYVLVGMNKSYIHIDEAYSYGLSNYNRVEIEDNADFFNNWHNKEYYEDYLSVQKKEAGNFAPVYENQKNDVHPPLYYVFLRIAMEFTIGHFSKWTGITLNIIIYAFITVFMYVILKKLLQNEDNFKIKSMILAFMSSIILASLSNVIYIRMYALLTLEILITILLHIKLLESEKINFKLLLGIGLAVLTGILTHYYYLLYLVIVYFIFFIKLIKEKKLKELGYYTATIIISGILSLIIFPYSIEHIFFGYRGQGALSNFSNIKEILPGIKEQIRNLNYYVFHKLMYVILGIMLAVFVYNKIRKKSMCKLSKMEKEILMIIILPSLFFFFVSTIASPWKVLRYFVPICGLVFVFVIYWFYRLLRTAFNEKITNIVMCILFCGILVAPFTFKLEPELLYKDNKELVQELEGELNLPTIYLYNSQNGGFLNDILLFSKIDESYIAKDMECTEENIQGIVKDKDITKGIILFINDEQDKETLTETVKEALDFTNYEHLQRLFNCDVYYIY